MNIGQSRQQFPDEDSCRQFFEIARQSNGRTLPHFECNAAYFNIGNGEQKLFNSENIELDDDKFPISYDFQSCQMLDIIGNGQSE